MTISTALVLVATILGGVSTLLAGASLILHALAPHTKTKLDDKAAADIDKLKSDVDKLTKLLPITTSNVKQSGRVRLTLVALLALFAVVGCSFVGCGASQRAALKTLGHCEETAAVKDLEGPVKTIGDDFVNGTLSKDKALALLDSFAASYGLDTLGCAVTFVGQLFSSKVSGSADTSKATDLYNEWLAKHGMQAKQAMCGMPAQTVAAASAANLVTTITGSGLCINASGVAEPCSHAFDSTTNGPLSVSGAITGDGAVATLPFASNAQTLEYVTPDSTFYGFDPQETEVTADGHVYIWHFGSDGVATYTVAPTVKP